MRGVGTCAGGICGYCLSSGEVTRGKRMRYEAQHPSNPSALDVVAQRAQTVREARQAAEDYAQAVRQALEAGETVHDVALAAGVTIHAVYKLMNRRWPKPAPLGD